MAVEVVDVYESKDGAIVAILEMGSGELAEVSADSYDQLEGYVDAVCPNGVDGIGLVNPYRRGATTGEVCVALTVVCSVVVSGMMVLAHHMAISAVTF